MTVDEEELVAYREKVVAEVEVRALRLKEIEVQVAQIAQVIDTFPSSNVLRGSAARGQARMAHERLQKRRYSDLCKQRDQAAADLVRAERRLCEVDERLKEEAQEKR